MPIQPQKIISLKIDGGFLGKQQFRFSDGLNCIIGGRGTGKTTVLEFIRYALGAEKYDAPVQKHVEGLVKENLPGGYVEVEFQTSDGVPYTINRDSNGEIIIRDINGTVCGVTVDTFRADIFSQNQIERIAKDHVLQLQLIDSFRKAELDAVNKEITECGSQIAENAARICEMKRQLGGLVNESEQLSGVEARLKELGGGGRIQLNAETNEAYEAQTRRGTEKDHLAALMQRLNGLSEGVEGVRDLLESGLDPIPASCQSSPNRAIVDVIQSRAEGKIPEFRQAFDTVAADLEALMQTARQAAADLDKAHAEQHLAFQQIMAKDQQEQQISGERSNLEKRRAEMLEKKNKLSAVQVSLEELEQNHVRLAGRFSELRDRRYGIRDDVAQEMNRVLLPEIRVCILQNSDRRAFKGDLESILKNVDHCFRLTDVATKVSADMTPLDFVEAIRADDEAALQRTGLNPSQAKKVVDALRDTKELYLLDAMDIPDLPKIELNVGTPENPDYHESHMLSTGQKCTSILPILLLDSDRPLLIDQPEDNLDNRFIFTNIVKRLENTKRHRQLLFITHNPNIPVLGRQTKSSF